MGKLKIDLNFALKRIDLAIRGHSENRFLGNYKSVFKGQGLEFEDYRKYSPATDDASLIDWKASKRVNDLMVKEFKEERNIDVVFLVDVSSQMLTGSTDRLKAEYIAELVSAFSYSVLGAGDSVGVVLFSDKVTKVMPPESGMSRYFAITKTLSDTAYYQGYANIDSALNYAFNTFNDGALVILISDFIYGVGSEDLLKLCSKKFDFISILIRDPVDLELPAGTGQVSLQDPLTGRSLLVDPHKVRKFYAIHNYRQVANTEDLLTQFGADFLFLRTDESFVKHFVSFFKKRQRKWR